MHYRVKNHPAYVGVTIHESWSDFEVFYKDMGPRPSDELSLDRIRGEEGYGPGNCRWATLEEQADNRPGFVHRIIHDGNPTNLKALCRKLNKPYLKTFKAFKSGKPLHQLLGVEENDLIIVE